MKGVSGIQRSRAERIRSVSRAMEKGIAFGLPVVPLENTSRHTSSADA